jgi:cellulose synthase/poly-beta-1,6-N-acetylglucosamine synthase-like glycosyltransferase
VIAVTIVIGLAALLLLVLAWVVYPAVMYLRARRLPRNDASAPVPDVAIIIATRDAPADVARRLDDLARSDYPASRRRVVVAVDVGAAASLADYASVLGSRATIVAGDPPGGKAATLNAGVRAAPDIPILVFADTGQAFEPSAISKLVASLGDPRWGGVTGRYTQRQNDRLMVAYATLEAAIRAGQAAGHSVVSTSGSIYAMRSSLWRPLPAGLICDDLFTTLSIVRQGHRVGFCGDALAIDPRTFTREQQFARRTRTLTGLIQYCVLEPGMLLPWRNPIWPHFVLHKLLRLMTPLLLALVLLAVLIVVAVKAPVLLLAIPAAALLAGALRIVGPQRWARVRDLTGWVMRLQLIPVVALRNGLRHQWSVWTP